MPLANEGKRSLVGSQDEGNQPMQIARLSWPNGGEAQKANGQSKTRSDWAALATDGTARCDIVIPVGALV